MSKNQPLSKEELEAILKAHNLDFSDIAKIANTIKASSTEETETTTLKAPKKVTSSLTYEITKLSYPDFVITKKTTAQTKELVVAPSCDGLFIRTLRKGGSWDVEQLNGENYALFMSDVPTDKLLELPDEFYIKTLERGKVFGDGLVQYLSDETIKRMIKDKCAPMFDKDQYASHRYYYGDSLKNIKKQKEIYNVFPIIYKEYAHSQSKQIIHLIKEAPGLVMFVYKNYGLDKARDFIEHCDLCMYDFKSGYCDCGYYNSHNYTNQEVFAKVCGDGKGVYETIKKYLPSRLPLINMDYESFKEYFLYESYRIGYASYSDFLSTWDDTLVMEYAFFGKIKEKYPKDLPIYHNKLVRRKNNYKYYNEPVFKSSFEKAAAKCKKFAWDSQESEYKYIVPLTTEDVVEEADQQSNCLVNANYMQRVIDGTSILVFMRKKKDVEHSFITMEICGNTIHQAYLASNAIPSREMKAEIAKYAEHFNLEYQG